MKKRVLSIILILTLLSAFASACGGSESAAPTDLTEADDNIEMEPEETTPPEDRPDITEADYGGETFTVYMRVNSTYNAEYIDAEGENGDVMNDNVWRRNVAVEEKYKISIETKTAKKPHSTVVSDISSGFLTINEDIECASRSST